ncbi:hypothetical protein CK203_035439 [Vitis vinifera]|uniref:Uncharacterized protein n=1 Tax=Vitis vinifera TaxID=29760 RepID=A0A438I3X8_VITVI|nr:hypothetical protein CK203_035439 [Vitis vinifera]
MIPGGRNFKELKEKKSGRNRSKTEQKQGKTELCEISQVKKLLRNEHFVAKPFRNTLEVSARYFAAAKAIWHTSATSQTVASIWQLRNALRSGKADFAPKVPFRRVFRNCESGFGTRVPLRSTVTLISQLRNALRSCCENGILLRNWRFVAKLKLTLRLPEPAVQASGHLLRSATSAKVRYPEMARTRGAKSSSPSNRKKSLRKEPVPDSAPEPSQPKAIPPPVKPAPPKPPARRYLTSLPNSITGSNSSAVSSSLAESLPVPSPVPSPAPQEKSQEPQAPLPEPQIPAETALEEVIRRPMLPQPPIEGNLDCRTRPFHSELCFDLAAFRVRPELAQSFQLLRSIGPKEGESSRSSLQDVRRIFLWASSSDHGSPSLFEEKVHKKKLQRADCIPLLFPRLLCQILEHLGYPSEPQLERKRICREPFTLDKWNNMTAYKVDQPEQPQPAARRASPRHIPEGITVAAPAIPRAPPAAPASSQPSTSAEPRMAIPISEYRELCRALETLTASQSSLAQRWQPSEHAKSRCWPLRLNKLPS